MKIFCRKSTWEQRQAYCWSTLFPQHSLFIEWTVISPCSTENMGLAPRLSGANRLAVTMEENRFISYSFCKINMGGPSEEFRFMSYLRLLDFLVGRNFGFRSIVPTSAQRWMLDCWGVMELPAPQIENVECRSVEKGPGKVICQTGGRCERVDVEWKVTTNSWIKRESVSVGWLQG